MRPDNLVISDDTMQLSSHSMHMDPVESGHFISCF